MVLKRPGQICIATPLDAPTICHQNISFSQIYFICRHFSYNFHCRLQRQYIFEDTSRIGSRAKELETGISKYFTPQNVKNVTWIGLEANTISIYDRCKKKQTQIYQLHVEFQELNWCKKRNSNTTNSREKCNYLRYLIPRSICDAWRENRKCLKRK